MSGHTGSSLLDRLERYREDRDVKGLLSILAGPIHPQMKARILRAVASVGTPEALEGLGRMAEQGRSEAAELAVRLLMRQSGEGVVEALSRGLSSHEAPWRLWVLKNLAQRPEAEAVMTILDAARDPDAQIRRVAARLLEEVSLDRRRMDPLDPQTVAEIREVVDSSLDRRQDLQTRLKRYRDRADAKNLSRFLVESVSPPVRQRALQYLAAMGNAEALRAVGDVLRGRDREIAEYGLRLLTDVEGDLAVRAMAKGLGSWDPAFRGFVLQRLQERTEPEVIRWLWEATKDDDPRIATVARSALLSSCEDTDRLARIPTEILDEIVRTLPSGRVRAMLAPPMPTPLRLAAIRWLGWEGGDRAGAVLVVFCLEEGPVFREAALDALESTKGLCAKEVEPLLRASAPEVRRRGAELFGRLAPKGGGAPLLSLTLDPDEGVRLAALQALINVEDSKDEALEMARVLISDESQPVRREAVGFLANVEDENATGALLLGAQDTDEEIAKKALVALAARGVCPGEHRARLLEILRRGASQSRPSAEEIDGLCAILRLVKGEALTTALDAVVAAARSNSIRLRRVAVETVESYPEVVRREALAQLDDTVDKNILRRVALTLGEARDPRGLIPMIRAVEECGGRVGGRCMALLREKDALQDLDFLIGAIRTRWPSVKKLAARELERLRSPASVDPLLHAMDDADLEVRIAAAQALRHFLDLERVAQRLADAVTYGDLSLRLAVIETIGEACLEGRRMPLAVDPLIRALGNRFLRKKAEVALKRMGDRKGILAVKRRKIRDQMIPKPPRPADLARMRMEGERAGETP